MTGYEANDADYIEQQSIMSSAEYNSGYNLDLTACKKCFDNIPRGETLCAWCIAEAA